MKPAVRDAESVDLTTASSSIVAPPLEQDGIVLQIQKDVMLDVNNSAGVELKQEKATASNNKELVSAAAAMALELEKLPPPDHHKLAGAPHSGNTTEQADSNSAVDANSALAISAPNNAAAPPKAALGMRPPRKLVGLAEKRENLRKMLTGGTDVSTKGQPKVVAIAGSRGLGKTALAEAVYVELKPKIFEGSRAFIWIGSDPDMKKICADVLRQMGLMLAADDLSDEEKACMHLRDHLRRGRYFIVFDDICNKETWDRVKLALPDKDSKFDGTVLVTTRDTALFSNNCLVLEELPDDQSKELFYRATFGVTKESLNEEHLARVSEKIDLILRKCNGVPLAILTMASQMACIPMSEWSGQENRSLDDIFQTDTKTNMNIKQCVLYLSMLPAADHWIEKDCLIWKWIAAGFVHSTDAMGPFEVGEVYFNMLIERRMIQPVNRYDKKNFREGCRVHNVIAEKIHLLSSENISCGVKQRLPSEGTKSYQVCIEGEISWKETFSFYGISDVYSLCAYRCGHIDWFMLSGAFRKLRVLDLVCCCFQTLSLYVVLGLLPSVQYLGLAGTRIFPTSNFLIWKTSYLQTLDLRHTGVQNLVIDDGDGGNRSDSEITKGQGSGSEITEGQGSGSEITEGKLLCLWCDVTTRFQVGSIKKLTSLQDLQVYFKSPNLVQELSRLTELRVLRIGLDDLGGDDDDQVGILKESLAELKKLTCLEIWCTSATRRCTVSSDLIAPYHHLRSLSLEGICFPSLPEWISPLHAPHLSRLAFAVEDLKVSDVRNLRGLPELTCLNMVAGGHHPADSEQDQGQGGRCAFEKLRFCTTNVPPSCFLSSPGAASLPSLEVLQFVVKVKDASTEFDLVLSLRHLEHVTILLDCWGAKDEEATEKEALRLAAKNGNHLTTVVIKEKQGAKLQVPLPSENLGSYPRGSEIAKMRTNQENLRKIQLQKELSMLDEQLKALKVKARIN